MKRAVLFDFWDSIIRYDFKNYSANEALLKHAIANPNQVTPVELAITFKTKFEEIRDFKGEVEVTFEETHKAVHAALGLKFDISYEEMELIYIENGHSLTPEPGLNELLNYLVKHDYVLGVVSNTILHSATQMKVLERVFKPNPFAFVISSSEHTYRKPHPKIFADAVKILQILPEQIYFVGDNFSCDVVGAKEAGMRPVFYNIKQQDSPHDFPYLEVANYLDLLNYFQALK